jgi:hypothetical protein
LFTQFLPYNATLEFIFEKEPLLTNEKNLALTSTEYVERLNGKRTKKQRVEETSKRGRKDRELRTRTAEQQRTEK